MQISLYTVSTCPYSQQEKQYLDGAGVAYTTIVLDQELTRLPEFLAASEGFSAVPVTMIAADDGTKTIVKGFDQKTLENELGGKAMPTGVEMSPSGGPSENQDVTTALPGYDASVQTQQNPPPASPDATP